MSDADHPDNKKLQGSPDFKGPGSDRKCTDVLFCLLLICAWVVMTVVGFVVLGWFENDNLAKGNPYRLINGIDDEGNICGVTDKVADFDKLYTTVTGAKICINKCPLDYCGLCLVDYEGNAYNGVPTTDFINYCVIDEAVDQATAGGSGKTAANGWEEVTADFWTAAGYIGGFGFPFAAGVCFLYLLLLRVPGVVLAMVWISILAILVMLCVVASQLMSTAKDWEDADPQLHTDTEVQFMIVMGYIFYISAGLYVCLMIFLRKRISLAMGIVKEAARAVGAMPLLPFFPLMQAAGGLVFLVIWVIYGLYLASSGELKVDEATGMRSMEYTTSTKYALLYMAFIFFWTTQFIVAFGQIVVAMCVASWYFVRDKSSIGSGTVMSSIRQTAVYHTGTAAFGSLIIAIIKTIRLMVSYLQHKAKQSNNKLAQIVLCVIQCCLWCLEKCMKFLNANAYTQTAIFGVSFCTAARRAFFLILRNAARVGAVTMVGNFVIFIGKLMITVVSAGAAYLAMDHNISEDLYGLMAPSILTALVAFMVADTFLNIFDMAVTTILQCFLADEEMFEGDQRFAEGDIKKWIEENGKMPEAASDAPASKL